MEIGNIKIHINIEFMYYIEIALAHITHIRVYIRKAAKFHFLFPLNNSMVLEKQIEKKLYQEVKARGGLALKFISPSLLGVPDRLVLLPGGRAYFVELKAPGKKSTLKQLKVQTMLCALGFQVRILDRFDAVMDFVEEVFKSA